MQVKMTPKIAINYEFQENQMSCFRIRICILLFIVLVNSPMQADWPEHDIRDLSWHFLPSAGMGPWTVTPAAGHHISTTDHPGLLTLRLANANQEVKGLLPDPIRLSDYPPPWEFETNVIHSFWGKTRPDDYNMAIGLNVAVTFSDPSTWPADRNQAPPDLRSFQLLIVHRGSRFKSNEEFILWGRGNLDPSGVLRGNWTNIQATKVGDGQKDYGPANTDAFLRFRITGSNSINFGWRALPDRAYTSRTITIPAQWGDITGIWEIGPIITNDAWMQQQWPGSAPMPADNDFYVGHGEFRYAPPFPALDVISNDFNIPGTMGFFQTEFHGLAAETYSNPGYVTFTMRGVNNYTGGSSTEGTRFNINTYPLPWEIETCFIAPDDSVPWDFHMNWTVFDTAGNRMGGWRPGVVNVPGQGIKAGNVGAVGTGYGVSNLYIDTGFGPNYTTQPPQSVLSSKPLYMLIRMVDNRHFQMGVKAQPEDEWIMTPLYESSFVIGSFGENAFSFFQPLGAPAWQKLLIDYWHYRTLGEPPPTATPSPTPDPSAEPEVLLDEDWEDCQIDTALWDVHNEPGIGSVSVVDTGGGNCALKISSSNWGPYIYSRDTFDRGRDIRCTFKIWWEDPSQTPGASGFHGPWHLNNSSHPWLTAEAMVSLWWNVFRWEEPGQIQTGPELPALNPAYQAANSPQTALTLRVWLSDARGALLEMSRNQGSTWEVLIDTHGTGPGQNLNNYIGWGTFGDAGDGSMRSIYLDDIIVERDAESSGVLNAWMAE